MHTPLLYWRKIAAGRYHSCSDWSRWQFDHRHDWLVERNGRSWKVTPPADLDADQRSAWDQTELEESDYLWMPENEFVFETLKKAQAVVKRFAKTISAFCDCGTKLVRDDLSAEYGDYCPNENCSVVGRAV